MDLFINRIYKPKRILFFIEADKESKEQFYKGILPDELLKYEGDFGTYDCPGLFRLKIGGKAMEVLGIEYRPDDESISYPDGFKSIILPEGFMITASFANAITIDDEIVDSCLIEANKREPICHREVVAKADPEVVQIFTSHGKNRVFVQCEPVSEEAFFKTKDPVTDSEKALYEVAYHDFITGYYNWNHINPIIGGFGLKGIQDFAFVHFDVKDFNAINIIYGHTVANYVLTRITEHMDKQDWIYHGARCDNDNFAMMIKDMPNEEIYEKLKNFFDEISVLEEDKHYKIFYRVGVVPMRTALLLSDRVADGGKVAQRMGVKLNETEINFYTDDMNYEIFWAKKIKAYLDTAIENDEFLVYLQPKYDVVSERITGAEALIRWNYQHKEMLSPGKFIPIFEMDGSISKLDDIVLKKVCQYLKEWKEKGMKLYPISVNLSRKRMENPNLTEHLSSIVDSYGVDHKYIDFELTETAAYNNQEYMISVIQKLKEAGYKISMDDFGTGYSSLSLLTLMPLDTLKIDKSFVDGIGTDKEEYKERAVIKHVICMAKDLGFNCLAEGAEEKKQVELLRNFGCELIQGYYYSRPLPVEEYVSKILTEGC